MAASKLLRNEFSSNTTNDAEIFQALFRAVKPDVLTIVNQATSKKLDALALCLIEQEKLVVNAPDFATKEAILQNITALRLLCDAIQAELISARESNPAGGGVCGT